MSVSTEEHIYESIKSWLKIIIQTKRKDNRGKERGQKGIALQNQLCSNKFKVMCRVSVFIVSYRIEVHRNTQNNDIHRGLLCIKRRMFHFIYTNSIVSLSEHPLVPVCSDSISPNDCNDCTFLSLHMHGQNHELNLWSVAIVCELVYGIPPRSDSNPIPTMIQKASLTIHSLSSAILTPLDPNMFR